MYDQCYISFQHNLWWFLLVPEGMADCMRCRDRCGRMCFTGQSRQSNFIIKQQVLGLQQREVSAVPNLHKLLQVDVGTKGGVE